ncbi:MAG: DUF3226 domain-containing protein [Bacteroidota bacterium]
MPPPRQIEQQRQLVVEGRDCAAFFTALMKEVGIAGVQVQDFGGKDELIGFLKALRNQPGFLTTVVSVGVVRDADDHPVSAFQSVCGALRNAGLGVPNRPEEFEGRGPKVGVLVLPSSTTQGMLESLCLQAVSYDPAMECVDDFFDCVKRRTGSLPQNLLKAQVQAFLASRARAGLLLGHAASAGYWLFRNAVFDHVKQFIRDL